MTETTTITETKKALSPADEMRTAAATLETARTKATASPWRARPVWSPDSKSTSAVYSHAHPTGTVESEVVASGRIRSGYGGTRNPYNVIYFTLLQPENVKPLVKWLRDEADRWNVEVTASQVDCANCYTAADCIAPHAEALYHSDDCERIFEPPTDENESADWRCDCFDSAVTFARGINTTWEEM